jgi:uncharacterized protein YuzE
VFVRVIRVQRIFFTEIPIEPKNISIAKSVNGVTMEKENMATVNLDQVITFVPQVLQLNQKNIWLSYDEEADVLYLNFKKPSHADDSELLDNDIIVRYENDEIIGMTILNASKKVKAK